MIKRKNKKETADGEFEKALKDGFDKYAGEKLSEIPDLSAEPFNQRLYRKCLPTEKRRSRALGAVMLAASVGAVVIAAMMFAKVADSENAAVRLPEIPNVTKSGEKADNSADGKTYGSENVTDKIVVTLTASGKSTDLPTEPSAPEDTTAIIENSEGYFEPNHFDSAVGSLNIGGSGEFADSEYVVLLDNLSVKELYRESTFAKDGYGYCGRVRIYLSVEDGKVPAAVSYKINAGSGSPYSCAVKGVREDGGLVPLHYYVCDETTDGEYKVSFYIGLGEDGVPTSMAFDEICVQFDFVELTSEKDADIPDFVIYGADAGETIVYADYLVRNGSICSVSTNAEKLTIGSSFGGTEIKNIKSGAVNGEDAPNLVSLTVSEGIEVISAGAFANCERLAEVNLPSSLKPGFVGKTELLYPTTEAYIREINENADLNGDGQIGRPFSSLFENCKSLSAVNIAKGSSHFKSSDGIVYTVDGLKIFDPAENRIKNADISGAVK